MVRFLSAIILMCLIGYYCNEVAMVFIGDIVQLGCRLLEMMLETSLVQASGSDNGDDFGELRPAFQHKFKNHCLRQK